MAIFSDFDHIVCSKSIATEKEEFLLFISKAAFDYSEIVNFQGRTL